MAEECLSLDKRFIGTLEKKKTLGADPLDPCLWENFIEARRSLVDYTTQNLNILAGDKKSASRNSDIKDRLETALGEVMQLEEKLASFLSENLAALKDTIDGISKNQAIFTQYAKNNYKPQAEAFESRA
jgi:hypothetical protein